MSDLDIQVIENCISLDQQNAIQDLVENSKLPLFYNPVTVYDAVKTDNENERDSFQFTHTFFKEGGVPSNWMNEALSIHSSIWNTVKPTKKLYLACCKLNLNTQRKDFTTNQHFVIHADVPDHQGITGIYYVNDCDGDTLFFDKMGKHVVKKVTPKKGTAILFDNKILHAGQPPKDLPYKAVINFNWLELK